MRFFFHTALLLTLLPGSLLAHAQQTGAARTATAPPTSSILSVEETTRLMPASVFFKGQTAPIQARNSAGVRFPGNTLLLAALVDTSGYSSQVQERYQAYLITEQPISVDGHNLPAGAYGIGFLAGGTFVVMDLGGHDLFLAHSMADPDLRRPRPLQVLPDDAKPGQYRLYEGRNYISLQPTSLHPDRP